MGAKGQKMMTVAQAVATSDKPEAKRKPTGALAAVNESTKSIMETEKAYKEASEPSPAQAQRLGGELGGSNFESELKKKRKKTRTSFAGDTGGYGGNTKLG
jgi:hypothetical protein